MKDDPLKPNIQQSINKDKTDKNSKIVNSSHKPSEIHCEDIIFEKEYLNSEINKYLNIINSTNKNSFPAPKNDLSKKNIFSPQKLKNISLSIDSNNKRFLTIDYDNEKKLKQKKKSIIVKNILESICHKPSESYETISPNIDLKLYKNICPGPGDYSPRYENSNFNLRYKNIFDTHSKKNVSLLAKQYEEKYYEENVGPGSYNLVNNYDNKSYFKKPKCFISSLGRSEFITVENPKIGPGSYEVGESFDKNSVGNHIFTISPLKNKKNKLEIIEKNILNKGNINNKELSYSEKRNKYRDLKKYSKHKNCLWKKIGDLNNGNNETKSLNILITSDNRNSKDNKDIINNNKYDYIYEQEHKKEKSEKKKLLYRNKKYGDSLQDKNKIYTENNNNNNDSIDKTTELIKKKYNELGLNNY